jgi:hypothetical protein
LPAWQKRARFAEAIPKIADGQEAANHRSLGP